MSLYKTFTEEEKKALRLHHLETDKPSQTADAFVSGMRYAVKWKSEQDAITQYYEDRANSGQAALTAHR